MTTVGVVREAGAGERRVALTPDGAGRLRALGLDVLVEAGAGAAAWFGDEGYAAAGATVTDRARVLADADILVCIHPPPDAGALPEGRMLAGLLSPLTDAPLVRRLAEAKVTAVSLDLLPRTLSRAQAMDALSSQANVAGYKAVLVAAEAYGGFFPMLMTAAGTTRPAQVLVLGAGVAGLQAIATARRLGAMITGYDVRAAARADIASTGAAVLDLPGPEATGAGGYARRLTDAEARAQQQALDAAVARFDVVITTAQVPGARPPELVSTAAVRALRPGSVVVDLAAGPLGGNVAGSVPDQTVVTAHGVTLIGAAHLPATVPQAASTAYSRNVCALLPALLRDGVITVDPADDIQAGVVVTHDGQIVQPAVRTALDNREAGS
ncbi:NAD(P) transhydrogenase subunit alpha [Jidongwangia harbinensis]|uniref:NAD(P) transhydrogenase subunit alpha n=1 Tax=Jidongwangia harbinensis TaxID=2878561 RepID=UPI001CD92DCB|nr:NAD(P) transhydrogenase subunit alpha [Jidongwangia harbinensis]MCA2211904.1 NAD(P) transhydrogenase subunit alpha [Jidongwangia harbinensis]